MRRKAIIATIEAHGAFMSEENEMVLYDRRNDSRYDEADLALRTCRCGTIFDGVDEYTFHLIEVFRGVASTKDGAS